MQTSPEVLHQDLADFRVSQPDLTLLQYVDDILLTAETEQECLQVFSFVYDYETCQLLAAPIYFREDMGIEEPADGVNFHSGK
ncbi:hypothetical protein STEG23_017078, partial [Scotinomys teguina]